MASFVGTRTTLEKKARKAGWKWGAKAAVGNAITCPSQFLVVFHAYERGALDWLLAAGRRLDKGVVVSA